MVEASGDVVRIEPEARVVALARTIEARGAAAERALRDDVAEDGRFGETCLGQALYRHRSVRGDASPAPIWSHLELRYFRGFVPHEVIRGLVAEWRPPSMTLLRAEVLLTTPSSFLLPRGWRGSAERPDLQTSLEFIQAEPRRLAEYRGVMRDYCGPTAAKLVEAGRFGTFRAMETAAVLHQDPALNINWNQIHLCELDAAGFEGFGRAFAAALGDPATETAFAGLDHIRTVPCWTFNSVVVEADAALAELT